MKEELLHFIWRYKLIRPGELKTVTGTSVKILKPGELNVDSGPDFFNAQIQVNDITLAGNVEIHIKTSDWLKHGHQKDAAYNKIILHVVHKHDAILDQNQDYNVEVLELKEYVDKSILERYEALSSSEFSLACQPGIRNIEALKLENWLQRMLIERLEKKIDQVRQLFAMAEHDHSQTFYFLLARNFGFKVNAGPFELLAKNLPLHLLLKHQNNLLQIEALLFGTAGFLNDQFSDKYLGQLQNEFEFLKNKYQLKPMDKSLWKFSRLRPANFPTVRLSQFALMLHHSSALMLNPLAYAGLSQLTQALSYKHEGYWGEHYKPGDEKTDRLNGMGKSSIENIMINTMAPFLFFFGKQTGNEHFVEAALRCFDEISFEDNVKTRIYLKAGLKFSTAGHSQALINLHDNYCKGKHCLKCAVAAQLLVN